MSLPRILSFDSNGELLQKSVEEINNVKYDNFHDENLTINNSVAVEKFEDDCLQVRAVIAPSDSWSDPILCTSLD